MGPAGNKGAKEKKTTPNKRRKGAERNNADGGNIDRENPNREWVYKTGWLSGADLYRRYAGGDDADDGSSSDGEDSDRDDDDVETAFQDD